MCDEQVVELRWTLGDLLGMAEQHWLACSAPPLHQAQREREREREREKGGEREGKRKSKRKRARERV